MTTTTATRIGTVTIPEGAEAFEDHRFETAGAYVRLIPTPGTYELVPDGRIDSMVRAEIPCTQVESYYPNRLLTETRARIDRTERPGVHHLRMRVWEVKDRTTRQGWIVRQG